MRNSSVEDFRAICGHFGVDIKKGKVLEVGGSNDVYLKPRFGGDASVIKNPLLSINPDIISLDKGFNEDELQTNSTIRLGFLNRDDLTPYLEEFDFAISFDTLEYIADPFLFCENLSYVN